MLIDWFTVGAQTLNFLILAWLLKRFLYRPILEAIDGREKSIAKKLTDASVAKADAKKERDDFQQKNAEFEQQRAALSQQATDEVKSEREKLLDEARKAADALHVKRQASLRTEQQSLNDEIGRRIRAEVFAVARKLLADLAGATLEERMSAVFAQRLRELDGEALASFALAIKSSVDPVLVRSASDLPAAQQAEIQQACKETFKTRSKIHFETAPELIAGMELSVNGQKLAWSANDYLGSLEKSIAELLQGQSETAPDVKTASEVKHQAKPKGEIKTVHRKPE